MFNLITMILFYGSVGFVTFGGEYATLDACQAAGVAIETAGKEADQDTVYKWWCQPAGKLPLSRGIFALPQ